MQHRLDYIDKEAELERAYPLGTKVTQDEYPNVAFTVVAYWRGGLRLEEPTHHTTHVADPRHVAKLAEAREL